MEKKVAKQILFIQGAGKNAHKEDAKLVERLQRALGTSYDVRFPVMKKEENASFKEWAAQIKQEITAASEKVIFVGHSVGASILIKFLCEQSNKNVEGIFLLAVAFWGGDGWKYEGYEKLLLASDAALTIPDDVPIFLYHAQDDETVPFAHLALYATKFPQAIARTFNSGGHQLENDLEVVTADIKNIERN